MFSGRKLMKQVFWAMLVVVLGFFRLTVVQWWGFVFLSLRVVIMGGVTSSSIGVPAEQKNPKTITKTTEQDQKPKKKICCACPETKKLRDECIVQNGEDACGKWIEAHKQCLRAEGFNV
ncbi:cytochrome c oxidase copper chaperone 1-like isoform X2 [Spinacia oleracea]|uniref:Cytochrome c oxidase copper chaperone 1-like isoform X2 n=1 Tax=Spinacia oleracea TaxID=3562 RepID=A0ABM3QJN1_SPIOL|nr:cytochrome c oxidase copper chaperone 1-like isoform X2 [Spinacia oleracea]